MMKFRELGGFAEEKNRITVMYCMGVEILGVSGINDGNCLTPNQVGCWSPPETHYVPYPRCSEWLPS